MTTTTVLRTLTFPLPAAPLTLNQRLHWARRAGLTRLWRETTFWHASAKYGGNSRTAETLPPSIVDIAIPVRTRHKRDPHNCIPTLKVAIDGLVDAGWWPDDNSDWVTTMEPVLVVGGDLVCITVRTR